jgi:hypothetical protein
MRPILYACIFDPMCQNRNVRWQLIPSLVPGRHVLKLEVGQLPGDTRDPSASTWRTRVRISSVFLGLDGNFCHPKISLFVAIRAQIRSADRRN